MLKVGQIGLGNWGKRFLLVLNGIANVAVCANHSRQDERNWLGRKYPSIRHTFDIDDIINDVSIEAVFITSPIDTHYKITKQCLNGGKNVFVEKPMALSKEEVKELYSLARENNLALTAGYIFTYNPIFQHIEKLLVDDSINIILMQWEKYGTFKESILWNLVSHELSILYKLLGPSVLSIECIHKMGRITDMDSLLIKLHYEKKRCGIIIINRMSTIRRKSLLMETELGRLFLWENEKFSEYYDGKGYIEHFSNNLNTLKIELSNFIGMIETQNINYDEEMNIFISVVLNELMNQSQR